MFNSVIPLVVVIVGGRNPRTLFLFVYSLVCLCFNSYDDAIPVEPGDVLKTTCEYSSTYKSRTVTFGESTQEEMCYAFLYFYPVQAMLASPMCTTYGSLSG